MKLQVTPDDRKHTNQFCKGHLDSWKITDKSLDWILWAKLIK